MFSRYWLFWTLLLQLAVGALSSEPPAWSPPSYEFENVFPESAVYRRNASAVYASSLVGGQPVYVSMTTMSSRIGRVHKTIRAIFEGPVIPDRLYLFISRAPFLLDAGIANKSVIPEELRAMALEQLLPLTIVFTDNLGSHRKLLPLLALKWQEDCVIATFDDEPKDEGKVQQYLSQLVKYYLASNRTAVVSLKARRIGMCREPPWTIRNYGYWGVASAGKLEMFLLPTGTGSVLYRPRFFHPIVFDPVLRALTHTADDIMFRLGALANRVPVVTGCRNSHQRDKATGAVTVVACPEEAYTTPIAASSFSLKNGGQRRRLLVGSATSLSQLNLHKRGNDYAWRNATAYLLERSVLNMTALGLELMPSDRGESCNPLLWDQQPLRQRTDPEAKLLQKQRRACSLTKCSKAKNQTATLR